MPLSRASTRGRYSHIVGVTSWYQSVPDLGAPCLIESLVLLSLEKCFESYKIIYIEE